MKSTGSPHRLVILFSAILILMLIVTGWATMKESILVGTPLVLGEPWGLATLADAYCGFLTFYAWVFYKESSFLSRVCWLIGILALGNIAMSIYVLLQIYKLPKGASIEAILMKKGRTSAGV